MKRRVDSRATQIGRLREILGDIDLSPARQAILTGRYLDYAGWLDDAARRAQRVHYLLRITALVGGVLLPAIASLDALSDVDALRWVTVGIGVIVGLSVALDGFMNLGERWLHFRLAAETVQSELWQFATLSGERYEGKGSYEDAFPILVVEYERFIATEVATYVKGPARESSDRTREVT